MKLFRFNNNIQRPTMLTCFDPLVTTSKFFRIFRKIVKNAKIVKNKGKNPKFSASLRSADSFQNQPALIISVKRGFFLAFGPWKSIFFLDYQLLEPHPFFTF